MCIEVLIDTLIDKLPYEVIEQIYFIHLDYSARIIQKYWRKHYNRPFIPENHCKYKCQCPYCVKWRLIHYNNRDTKNCNQEHNINITETKETDFTVKYRRLLSYRCFNEFNIYPFITYVRHL